MSSKWLWCGWLTIMVGVALLAGAGSPKASVPGADAAGESVAVSGESDHAEVVRLRELRREIARHDELYHRRAQPEISDHEYDLLKAELRALEERLGAVAEEEAVGDDRRVGSTQHAHREPMLSLGKAYTDEEQAAFVSRLEARLGGGPAKFRVEPKYDGLAVSLTYERGRLVRALTRGNGTEGDDVTAGVRSLVLGVVERLGATSVGGDSPADGGAWNGPDLVELRGEIYMTLPEFERLNAARVAAGEELFANPRSVAVGTLRASDPQDVADRRLELVCYGWGAWLPAAGRPVSLGEFRERAAAWGLPVVVMDEVAVGRVDLRRAVEAVRAAAPGLGLPVDGVVIKLESVAQQEELGLAPSAPRWALARKFEPERVSTRLLGITLQVGRTGTLTPVAELAPVELSGSTIARATLHNADEISRRDIRVGDWVILEKAGEIIPAIVGVDKSRRTGAELPYVFPEVCPACGGALLRAEDAAVIRCVNRSCPAQVTRRLVHYASASGMDIKGLGPAIVENLVARGLARSPADLYRLALEDWEALPRIGGVSARQLMDALEASRALSRTDGSRLVFALGLPGVGRQTARRLSIQAASLESLVAWDEAVLSAPISEGGVGLSAALAREVAKALGDDEVRAELLALRDVGVGTTWSRAQSLHAVKEDEAANSQAPSLHGQVVVLTGGLDRWTRTEAARVLVAAGATIGSSFTRQTTLVVAGREPGATLAKAAERGVEVIDEAELVRRLRAGGVIGPE